RELLWLFEELDDLPQLTDCLICTAHIIKGDADILCLNFGSFAFADPQYSTGTHGRPGHLAITHIPDAPDQKQWQTVSQQEASHGAGRRTDTVAHAGLIQCRDQGRVTFWD